jgi:hypothetical protein
MKKIVAFTLSAFALCAIAILPSKNAIGAFADGSDEEISEIVEISSEEPLEETSEPISEEVASSSEQKKEEGIVYTIKEAHIGYRDNDGESYADGDSKVVAYFLSADGWKEEDTEPIVMTVKGAVTTKLDSKILYVYEYKPTKVVWNNFEVKQNEDKTFTLVKPAEKGEYDLAIYFTKTAITNPVDLVGLNWASVLTVQNLMTIGSWLALIIGLCVVYGMSIKYKKRGTTTLQEVKSQLTEQIEEKFGENTAKAFSETLDKIIAPSFEAILQKLNKQDNNMTTLVRCMLLMQENTPEARLAITECLSKLDSSADEQAAQVKAIIEAEMTKYREETEARERALQEAVERNKKYAETADEGHQEQENTEQAEDEYGAL